MKKSKIIAIIIFIILLTVGGIFGYYYFIKKDVNTTLTVAEKQWIESNKNKVYDIEILTDIPILNFEGKGVILDFLADIEEDTGIKFNKIVSLDNSSTKGEYGFVKMNKVDEKDILLFQDYYVLLSKNSSNYFNTKELKNKKVGVLSNLIDKTSNYLTGSENLSYQAYETEELLINALTSGMVDLISLPRLDSLKTVLASKEVTIAFHMTDYKDNYVINLGSDDRLNTILKKYFKKWESNNFESKFNDYLTSNYFSLSDLTDKEKATLKSKTYIYGYIPELPLEGLKNNKLVGYNARVLRKFVAATGIKVEFSSKHSNLKDLLKGFNNNEIDIYYGINNNEDYKVDVYKTIAPFSKEGAIISHIKNKTDINSLASLEGISVMTINDSYYKSMVSSRGANAQGYDNVNSLLKNINENSIIVVDLNTYNFYKTSDFKNYKLDATFNMDKTLGFNIRNISANQVFAEYFNFYLTFVNKKEIINDVNSSLLVISTKTNIFIHLLTLLGGIVVLMFAIFGLYKYLHTKTKQVLKLTRNDKIKYIDVLTSLKNRAYLNDNIDYWDSSEVYPQSIVVVDLNNIAYINDNYGYQEGDNVIKEAANILIKTQQENSEIIRTSGNEFLIYLVGYEEKEITSYVKLLNKEMKSVAHGFGSAIGYSMILDQIKTVDDAINEATIQMREVKEEQAEE
jgi:diguanylate cyclase (GGDEF)-like protein